MRMSNESILVILFVGLIAGWLAGQIVRGTGFGIIGDILVGIAGALVASLLFPRLGISIGTGLVREILYSAIGAIILLVVVRAAPKRRPVLTSRGRSGVFPKSRLITMGPSRKKAPFRSLDAERCYSTTSTMRLVRGSTSTVRPFTTV